VDQILDVDGTLTETDARRCALAVAIYAKHLDGLAKEAAALGRSAEQQKYEGEASGLRAEIVEPAESGAEFHFYGRHRQIVEKGLEFIAKNMKAAKGTLKPLGYDKFIEQLDADASHIEGALLPLFREQGELHLVEDEPVRVDDDAAGELQAAAESTK